MCRPGSMSISANRVAYVFGFRGPSVTSDTACSSSLVAADQAVSNLWRGRCSSSIAAGARHPVRMWADAPAVGRCVLSACVLTMCVCLLSRSRVVLRARLSLSLSVFRASIALSHVAMLCRSCGILRKSQIAPPLIGTATVNILARSQDLSVQRGVEPDRNCRPILRTGRVVGPFTTAHAPKSPRRLELAFVGACGSRVCSAGCGRGHGWAKEGGSRIHESSMPLRAAFTGRSYLSVRDFQASGDGCVGGIAGSLACARSGLRICGGWARHGTCQGVEARANRGGKNKKRCRDDLCGKTPGRARADAG